MTNTDPTSSPSESSSGASPYEPPSAGGASPYEPPSAAQPPSAYEPPGPPSYEAPPPPPAPPYGAPGPYGAPPPKNNSVVLGIIGIITAILCCGPLGILFGWLSIREARRAGAEDTLGKVAFWLGIALTALAVIGTIIACAAGIFSTNWNTYRY